MSWLWVLPTGETGIPGTFIGVTPDGLGLDYFVPPGEALPVSGTITRDGEDYISQIDLQDDRRYVISRDENNQIETVELTGEHIWTMVRDGEGRITGWTLS